MNAQTRSRFEEVVRGLLLGILLISGLATWAMLAGPEGLARKPHGLIASALQLLLLGWVWMWRWGRDGSRWQFGCGYVGFATIAVDLYTRAFFGGGAWQMTMIGIAGVVYGLVPMARRAHDAAVEQTPVTDPSPVGAHEPAPLPEARFQVQTLALLILLFWAILVGTNIGAFIAFMARKEGLISAAFMWMFIGGLWWFSIGRRGFTAKSVAAAVACAFMAANLYAEAFLKGGEWLVTAVALLVQLAALGQWLPNRGMEVLPRSPSLDGPAPMPAEAGDHGHHH